LKLVPSSILALALTLPLLGCSGGEPDADVGQADQALESTVDCRRERQPAYEDGRSLGDVDVIRVGGKRTTVRTGHAFLALQRLADERGIDVQISSGFRTMAEQQHLWRCYQTGACNDGNLAARPGYSNHQSGTALDLSTSQRTALNRLIENEGLAWRRTVPSEPWHYEYQGPDVPGPCD
jgi:hypothetical protein